MPVVTGDAVALGKFSAPRSRKDRFALDSPLEEAGFEPLVPLNDRGRIVGLHLLFIGLALSRDLHSKGCTFTGI